MDNAKNVSINIHFNQDSMKYRFGNFAREYCGLQTLINPSDVRLTVFLRHAYLFKDKDVLDIGCNVGHMTIAVGRRLQPKTILGVDIDKNLIARARKNLSLFQRNSAIQSPNIKSRVEKTNLCSNIMEEKLSKRTRIHSKTKDRIETNPIEYFPVSLPICLGSFPITNQNKESPWSSPSSNICSKISDTLSGGKHTMFRETSPMQHHLRTEDPTGMARTFPENVYFRTSNYAITDESQMISDKQQYDLILCLSLTKWIHLNFGDSGLKMTFRRMFNQLRPGGKLILEAQNWVMIFFFYSDHFIY